jgi:hypothetical protein
VVISLVIRDDYDAVGNCRVLSAVCTSYGINWMPPQRRGGLDV